jgi:hypothetical protein
VDFRVSQYPINDSIDMRSLQAARWLFFDMGNTLISEEASTACRIQRLAEAFDRHGASRSVEAIESAYKEASEKFAPRLVSKAIEKLLPTPLACCDPGSEIDVSWLSPGWLSPPPASRLVGIGSPLSESHR